MAAMPSFPLLGQFQPLMSPLLQVNQNAVSELEQLIAVQTGSLAACTDFILDRWKAAAEITDLVGFETFYRDQIEASTRLWKRMIDDGKTMVELEAGFRAKMCELMKDKVNDLGAARSC